MLISGINTFLRDNIWFYHSILAILTGLIIYCLYLIRKTRERKNFLAKLSSEQGPLAPRNLLSTLIDSIPDFIYIKDKEGRFIVANKMLAETVGENNPMNLIGQTDYNFYPRKLAEKFRLNEMEIMNSGKPILNLKEKGLDKYGNEIWVSTTKIPIMDQSGKVLGIAGIGRNINDTVLASERLEEQKKMLEETNILLEERQEEILQQQEELKMNTEQINLERSRLLTLINSIPDRIYIKDRESRFILGNNMVAKIMGAADPDELIGKTDYDFYSKEIAEAFYNDEQEQMESGDRIINKEERGLDEKGEEIIVSTTKVPFRNSEGEIIGVVGIGRDITLQKTDARELQKQSEELRQLNTELEEKHEEIHQQAEELKTQTENIELEKNQLLTLINAMPDRIYFKDRESRFIQGNIHVANIMGVDDPKKLTGKTDLDFFKDELAREFYKDEQDLMASDKKIINKEEPGVDEKGEPAIISTTKIPIKNEKGEVIGVVGIGRDITLQKKAFKELETQSEALKELNQLLEERQEEIQQQSEELKTQAENLAVANIELEKLSTVASKTGNVIIIMDGDGNFEWVNSRFVERYGMDLEQWKKEKGTNIMNNSSSGEISAVLEKIQKDKKPRIYNSSTTDKDGKKVWSQTTISPIMDINGNVISLIAIDSDISAIKEAEKQIEKQRDQLKILNNTKDKFFSIIAHDLKNPFHSIMGFSDLLTRSYESIDDEKKREFIHLINTSSTSAYALLENLLNWARTQTNKIKFEPSKLNLRPVINEIFIMMSVNAQNKNIELIPPEGEEDLTAYADFNMVNTIIRNLVGNGLKYTEPGGSISLSVVPENNRLLISISDTGIGMSQEVMDKLFKLDSISSKVGTSGEEGTGLGLIVSREFVIRHGSDFEIQSEPGKGSTFTFSLPTEKEKH